MRSLSLTGIVALCVAATACGGEDEEAPACAPTGSWNVTDTVTSSSGGLCSDFGTSSSVINITADSAAGTVTWTEDGFSYTGTLNRGTCQATVVTTTEEAFSDEAGNPYTLTASATRTATFSGNNMTGTLTVTVALDPPDVAGMPCTASGTTTGTRQ